MNADPEYFVDAKPKNFIVGRPPVEAAVRPDDVAVK